MICSRRQILSRVFDWLIDSRGTSDARWTGSLQAAVLDLVVVVLVRRPWLVVMLCVLRSGKRNRHGQRRLRHGRTSVGVSMGRMLMPHSVGSRGQGGNGRTTARGCFDNA